MDDRFTKDELIKLLECLRYSIRNVEEYQHANLEEKQRSLRPLVNLYEKTITMKRAMKS